MGFFTNHHQLTRLSRQVALLSEQVEHLTRLVELLARERGIGDAIIQQSRPEEEPFWQEARRLKHAGTPILAIKLVREHTGMGLRDAKESVDRL